MTVAQGTPKTDQLRKAVEDAWKDGGYQFWTEEEWLDEYGKLEAENAALSAQVVELQNTIRNARVQREAAEAHVEALQRQVAALQELVEHVSK